MKQEFNSVWDAIEKDPIRAENFKLRSVLMNGIVLKLSDVADSQKSPPLF